MSAYEKWLEERGRESATPAWDWHGGGTRRGGRLAERGTRLIARLVDAVLGLFAALPGAVCLLIAFRMTAGSGDKSEAPAAASLLLLAGLALLVLGIFGLEIYQIILLAR